MNDGILGKFRFVFCLNDRTSGFIAGFFATWDVNAFLRLVPDAFDRRFFHWLTMRESQAFQELIRASRISSLISEKVPSVPLDACREYNLPPAAIGSSRPKLSRSCLFLSSDLEHEIDWFGFAAVRARTMKSG